MSKTTKVLVVITVAFTGLFVVKKLLGRNRKKKREHVVVETTKGKVMGLKHEDGTAEFRGVPYAQAKRFQAPEPRDPWDGTLDCLRHGKRSVQRESVFVTCLLNPFLQKVVGFLRLIRVINAPLRFANMKSPLPLIHNVSEDCLSMIIQSPNVGKTLPVMVFIHGGAFIEGEGSGPLYTTGHKLAKEEVVFVSINYRLGALGFLKVDGGASNCGLRDQVRALKWVQEEISSFGGNPDDVTIFGESAGAISIAYLICLEETRSLYHSVILESCVPILGVPKDVADPVAKKMAELLKIDECRYELIKDIPAKLILAAQATLIDSHLFGVLTFGPTYDGEMFSDCPLRFFQENPDFLTGKRFIVGYLRDEGHLFVKIDDKVYNKHPTLEDVVNYISFSIGSLQNPVYDNEKLCEMAALDIVSLMEKEHERIHKTKATVADVYAMWMTKTFFNVPSLLFAYILRLNNDVYLYRFEAGSPLFDGKSAHALELFYVFGTYGISALTSFTGCNSQDVAGLSRVIRKSWTSFAKGNSDFQALSFSWAKLNEDLENTVVFDCIEPYATPQELKTTDIDKKILSLFEGSLEPHHLSLASITRT